MKHVPSAPGDPVDGLADLIEHGTPGDMERIAKAIGQDGAESK